GKSGGVAHLRAYSEVAVDVLPSVGPSAARVGVLRPDVGFVAFLRALENEGLAKVVTRQQLPAPTFEHRFVDGSDQAIPMPPPMRARSAARPPRLPLGQPGTPADRLALTLEVERPCRGTTAAAEVKCDQTVVLRGLARNGDEWVVLVPPRVVPREP